MRASREAFRRAIAADLKWYTLCASQRRGAAVEFFSYVMVLASVIVGLGITHLLQGIAGVVQHPGREKVYWVHLVWVAVIFLKALFWWWFQFRLSEIAQWSFALYLFVAGYAFLMYLSCALLFPRDLAGYEGFEDYFYSRRGWFFGVNLVSVAVDVADSLLKGFEHFRSLGPVYVICMGVMMILFAIGMHTRSKRFHAACAVASLGYMLLYPVTNFSVVQ